jgi:hypothetical protein
VKVIEVGVATLVENAGMTSPTAAICAVCVPSQAAIWAKAGA